MRTTPWSLLLLAVATLSSCGESSPTPSAHRADSEEALPAGVDLYLSDEDRSMADAAGVDLRQLVARALRDTDEQLSLEQTTIRMVVDPREVSARLGGVRGFTNPGTGIIDVWLNLDGSDSTVRNRITQNLPITLAHELHHSVRILRGPGYGRTLGQALVTEGLAVSFAHDVYPDKPQPKSAFANSTQEARLWQLARERLDSRSYDHGAWFFGEERFPPGTGYTIGYHLVEAYLQKTDKTAAKAVTEKASLIIDESNYSP